MPPRRPRAGGFSPNPLAPPSPTHPTGVGRLRVVCTDSVSCWPELQPPPKNLRSSRKAGVARPLPLWRLSSQRPALTAIAVTGNEETSSRHPARGSQRRSSQETTGKTHGRSPTLSPPGGPAARGTPPSPSFVYVFRDVPPQHIHLDRGPHVTEPYLTHGREPQKRPARLGKRAGTPFAFFFLFESQLPVETGIHAHHNCHTRQVAAGGQIRVTRFTPDSRASGRDA